MRGTVINNILSEKDKKNYVTIIKPLGNDVYQVRDAQGRVSKVESVIRWAAESKVVVKDGFIVGKSAKKLTRKVYQV